MSDIAGATDDLSIPPFLDRTPVTSDGALIPAQVMSLARRIRALVEKGDRAAEKAEQFYKAAGIHIKEIKQKQSEHWETIVREQCGIGQSRAYELMAIADGRTTLEKVRADTNERKKVHRAKPDPVSVPERTEQEERDRQECVALFQKAVDAERELAQHKASIKRRVTGGAEVDVEQHRARVAAVAEPVADEATAEVSAGHLAEFIKACWTHLPKLIGADRYRARELANMLTREASARSS
jgi:hypothetical protein